MRHVPPLPWPLPVELLLVPSTHRRKFMPSPAPTLKALLFCSTDQQHFFPPVPQTHLLPLATKPQHIPFLLTPLRPPPFERFTHTAHSDDATRRGCLPPSTPQLHNRRNASCIPLSPAAHEVAFIRGFAPLSSFRCLLLESSRLHMLVCHDAARRAAGTSCDNAGDAGEVNAGEGGKALLGAAGFVRPLISSDIVLTSFGSLPCCGARWPSSRPVSPSSSSSSVHNRRPDLCKWQETCSGADARVGRSTSHRCRSLPMPLIDLAFLQLDAMVGTHSRPTVLSSVSFLGSAGWQGGQLGTDRRWCGRQLAPGPGIPAAHGCAAIHPCGRAPGCDCP